MKKIILGLMVAVLVVGCGGGDGVSENPTTNNQGATPQTKQSINVSELKGYKVVIEYIEPITKEVEFFCDGGYKLSDIGPNTSPWVRNEYHSSMIHVSNDRLFLHYINSYSNSIIDDQYSITLFDGDIIVGESIFDNSTAFEYDVLEIHKVMNCN